MDISIYNMLDPLSFQLGGVWQKENIIVVGVLKEVGVYSGKYNTVQISVLFKIKGGKDYKPRKGWDKKGEQTWLYYCNAL